MRGYHLHDHHHQSAVIPGSRIMAKHRDQYSSVNTNPKTIIPRAVAVLLMLWGKCCCAPLLLQARLALFWNGAHRGVACGEGGKFEHTRYLVFRKPLQQGPLRDRVVKRLRNTPYQYVVKR